MSLNEVITHPRSSVFIIIGVGDGNVIRSFFTDKKLQDRLIVPIAMPSETVPKDLPPITVLKDDATLKKWGMSTFAPWDMTVRLGGCEVITPKLSEEAEKERQAWMPKIVKLLQERPQGLGNDINDTFQGLWNCARNAPDLLASTQIDQIAQTFSCPVISVAAGPSVKEHLDELRALQNKVLIVCCDAVLGSLISAGIQPHFCTPLERLVGNAPLCEPARGTETIFAGLAVCHPQSVQPFKRKVYIHAGDECYDWLRPGLNNRVCTGSSTGVLSVYVGLALTTGRVYLVGHDLAKKKDGASHLDSCKIALDDFAKQGNQFAPCDGYDGGEWYNTFWWSVFRDEIANAALQVPGRIVNVNAHYKRYAVIPGTDSGCLPEASTLPDLPPIRLPEPDAGILSAWKHRYESFSSDCDAIIEHCRDAEQKLDALMRSDPLQWEEEAPQKICTMRGKMAPDKLHAFNYLLRSMYYNDTMYWDGRRQKAAHKYQVNWYYALQFKSYLEAIPRIIADCKAAMT